MSCQSTVVLTIRYSARFLCTLLLQLSKKCNEKSQIRLSENYNCKLRCRLATLGTKCHTRCLPNTVVANNSSGCISRFATPCSNANLQNAVNVARFASTPYGNGSAPNRACDSRIKSLTHGRGVCEAVMSATRSMALAFASSKACIKFIAIHGF
jgi:hypothetical protein